MVDHLTDMTTGVVADSSLPPCADMAAARAGNPGTTACWFLDDGGMSCPTNDHVMKFNHPGTLPTTELNSSVSCSVLTCPVGQTLVPNVGCMCPAGKTKLGSECN